MKRRDFLRTAVTFTLIPAAGWNGVSPVFSADDTSVHTLDAAFQRLGFNPKAKENAFFAVTTDIHYGKEPENANHAAFRTVLSELNACPEDARPAFLAVLGDCGCSMAPSFGSAPILHDADREYTNLKKDLESLHPEIPVKLIAGNHDTPVGDSVSAHFCETFGVEPWYAFRCGGIQFLALDGGHDAFPCEKQKKWLTEQIQSLPNDVTLILMLHQPLNSANERGFAECLPELLAERTAEVFLLVGHEHCDNERAFALPHTRLTEFTHISCAGGWQKKGTMYWLYCISEGRIVGRIQRRSDGTYVPYASRNASRTPGKIRQPFDETSGKMVVRALLGEDDSVNILSGKGGNCGTFWFYVSHITAEIHIPKNVQNSKRKKLVILGNLASRLNRPAKTDEKTERFVTLSAPGIPAITVSPGPNMHENTHEIPIPDVFYASDSLIIEIQSLGYLANDTLAGFAVFEMEE